MDFQKVIITKHKATIKKKSLENEIGLSTYDLALISNNKISKNSNESANRTYLI